MKNIPKTNRGAIKHQGIKRKRILKKKKSGAKLHNFIIDKKGSSHTANKGNTRRNQDNKLRKAMGYNRLVERERELVSDLFGDDVEGPEELPPTPGASTQAPVTKVKEEKVGKKKKKKKVNKAGEKDVIPDDPFDVHGAEGETKRKPAWCDEDDETIKVKDVVATMTKARGSRGSRETSEQQYSQTLRSRFTQVVGGTPDWASLDNKVDQSDPTSKLTRTTGDYLGKSLLGNLPKTKLDYRRVRDLNHMSRTEGSIIRCVDFHPNLPIGLVGGCSNNKWGAVSLFKVDGETNNKIQSVKFPSFPVKCAKFLQDGRRFMAGSNLQYYFHLYDMEAGKETKVPCNLGTDRMVTQSFFVSPNGEHIVFLRKPGSLYLYDSKSTSHIATLQAPHQVTTAAFNDSGSKFYTHGIGGDVCVWDMNTRMCVHRFYDDGCIDGSSIAVSGSYLACGSSSGVVNVYDTSTLYSNTSPTPVKTLTHLVTEVDQLAFNPQSELLVTSSQNLEGAIKLVHFPSMTYFNNFPGATKGFKKLQMSKFSPGGGFLASGNNAGTAMLFRLHHYTNY